MAILSMLTLRRSVRLVALAAVAASAFLLGVRAAAQRAGDVIRLDPALDAIIAPDAKRETLVEDYFGGDEGPAWDKAAGHLLFRDQAANRLYRMTPDGKFSVDLENSGLTDFAALRGISPWDGNTGSGSRHPTSSQRPAQSFSSVSRSTRDWMRLTGSS